MNNPLRLATRQSALALWQAEHVQAQLQQLYPELRVELVPLTTRGDEILDQPLAKIGGKGLFLKELQQAILDGRADFAVHSLKDIPVEPTAELTVTSTLEREDPRDAFVSNDYVTPYVLPPQAIVGTSSQRRACQLNAAMGEKIQIADLRGNVNTRLQKLDNGDYHGIVLAAAGLKRLGLSNRISRYLPVQESLPAPGQGAIAIECRADDTALQQQLAPLHHAPTAACVSAERAFSQQLGGSCQIPLAAYAQIQQGQLHLSGLLGTPDGQTLLQDQLSGDVDAAVAIGQQLAAQFRANGADKILAQLNG